MAADPAGRRFCGAGRRAQVKLRARSPLGRSKQALPRAVGFDRLFSLALTRERDACPGMRLFVMLLGVPDRGHRLARARQSLRQSACVSTNAGRSIAPFRARRPLMDQRDF